MKLELAQIIYSLYIKRDRFICYFTSFQEAENFAKKYYRNEEAHIELNWVFNFNEE